MCAICKLYPWEHPFCIVRYMNDPHMEPPIWCCSSESTPTIHLQRLHRHGPAIHQQCRAIEWREVHCPDEALNLRTGMEWDPSSAFPSSTPWDCKSQWSLACSSDHSGWIRPSNGSFLSEKAKHSIERLGLRGLHMVGPVVIRALPSLYFTCNLVKWKRVSLMQQRPVGNTCQCCSRYLVASQWKKSSGRTSSWRTLKQSEGNKEALRCWMN